MSNNKSLIIDHSLCKGFAPGKECEELIIPEGITRIGVSAFQGCETIKKVIFPKSLKAISGEAFCNSCLKKAIFQGPVDIIGEAAFKYTELVEINVDVAHLENFAFEGCIFLTKANLGNRLKRIPVSAFYLCEKLEEFDVPKSVTSIGTCCFSNSGLKYIQLPETLEAIEYAAFENTMINSITLPENINIEKVEEFIVTPDITIKAPNSKIEELKKIFKHSNHKFKSSDLTLDELLEQGKSISEINKYLKSKEEVK